jgi:hypothetical protein
MDKEILIGLTSFLSKRHSSKEVVPQYLNNINHCLILY